MRSHQRLLRQSSTTPSAVDFYLQLRAVLNPTFGKYAGAGHNVMHDLLGRNGYRFLQGLWSPDELLRIAPRARFS